MRRAKKKLGEVGPGERARTSRELPPETRAREDARAVAGTPKSVESMLQEFSAAGSETHRPRAGRPAGKYDQLWQLSMADPHTGLANQLLLVDRLTQALARRRRHGGEVVVCHIDLDNLGEINLDLGYTTGNTVLCRDGAAADLGDAGGGHHRPGRRERSGRHPDRDRRTGGGARHPQAAAHASTSRSPSGAGTSASMPPWGSPWRRTPSPPKTSWPGRIAPPGSAGADGRPCLAGQSAAPRGGGPDREYTAL